MSDVKAIEKAVQSLAPDALEEFRRWFTEFDSTSWDRQIELDACSGKLDGLLAEAELDRKKSAPRSL